MTDKKRYSSKRIIKKNDQKGGNEDKTDIRKILKYCM